MRFNRMLAAGVLSISFISGCHDSGVEPEITPQAEPISSLSDPAASYVQTSTGFFYPTGTATFSSTCGIWLGRDINNGGCYGVTPGKYHIGYDMMTAFGQPVYAISRGTVVHRGTGWEYNNVGLGIRHTLADGTQFTALYGHIHSTLQVGDRVSGGVEIGTIGLSDGGNHLHFGIIPSTSLPGGPSWGALANSYWPWTNSFVDPLHWITSRTPKCENGTAEHYRPGGTYPTHPNGSLLQMPGDGTVYVLQGGYRRAIPTPARLWELYGPGRGFDFRDVITISSGEMAGYPRGADVSGPLPYNGRNEPDGRLIRQWGGSEISIVSDGYRRPFGSAKAFLALGYTFCNVANVSDYYSYPSGAAIWQ